MSPQLTALFSASWSKLATAGSKDAVFRSITVCNYSPENINAYTVVLREADADKNTLTFYTDHRSPKVKQLELNGKVTVVLYNDEEKLQLVLKGEAVIHYQNAVSQQHWQKSGCKGRRSYLAQPAPSTIINEAADGLDYLKGKDFNEHDLAGYENFAVVIIKLNYLEHLQLNHEGNRRAKFILNGSNEWDGVWLIP